MKILLTSANREGTFVISRLQWGLPLASLLLNLSDHHAMPHKLSENVPTLPKTLVLCPYPVCSSFPAGCLRCHSASGV